MRKAFTALVLLGLLVSAASLFAQPGSDSTAATQSRPVVFMAYMGHTSNDAFYKRLGDYIQQQTGVQFTYRDVPNSEDYTVQLTAAIAAQEKIDAFSSGKEDMLLNKSRGVIQELTDGINKYAPNIKKLFTDQPAWPELAKGTMWKGVTVGGKIWAIPGATGKDTGTILTIRRDWADKVGVWPIDTIEQFETYLRKVKVTDLNGNGKADEIPFNPMYGDSGLEGIACSMVYAFTGVVGWNHEWYKANYIDKGQVIPSILHPNFKTFLTTMSQWYKDGLINPDAATSTWDNDNDLLAANRVGATSSWYSDFYGAWQTLLEKEPKAVYEHRALKGPNGAPAKFGGNDPASASWTYTSWSPKDVVAAGLKLQDWFAANKDNYLVQVHGVQNVDWKYLNKGTDADRPEIEHISDKDYYSYSFLGYSAWNGAVIASADWRPQQYRKANLQIGKMQPWFNPDWFVGYDFSGTKIDTGYVDATTFINEAIVNIILNKAPVSTWDAKVAEYRKMWADEFVKVASAQYKAQGGK